VQSENALLANCVITLPSSKAILLILLPEKALPKLVIDLGKTISTFSKEFLKLAFPISFKVELKLRKEVLFL